MPLKLPAPSPLDAAVPSNDDAFAAMERQLREREEGRLLDEKRARLLANGVRIDMPDEYTGAGPVAVFGPEGRFQVLAGESKGKAKSLAVFS